MPEQERIVHPGADHAHALHALIRKYAEIVGHIGRARLTVQQLTADLAHIEGAISIFDPAIDISRIRAKHIPVREPAATGEVTSILLEALREAGRPLTPRELTEHLLVKRELAVDDRELFTLMLKRVRACLRSQRGRGILRPVAMEGAAQRWEVVN